MSHGDRPELPRTMTGAIPAIPVPTQTNPPTQTEEAARARISALEAEARGQGATVEQDETYRAGLRPCAFSSCGETVRLHHLATKSPEDGIDGVDADREHGSASP